MSAIASTHLLGCARHPDPKPASWLALPTSQRDPNPSAHRPAPTPGTSPRRRMGRAPRPGGAVLHPVAAHRPGHGGGRLQAVPLHRPGPLHVADRLDVEPRCLVGDRDAPVHRLPAPHGALLRAHGGARRPDVGGAAAVDGESAVPRRCRGPVLAAHSLPGDGAAPRRLTRHDHHRRRGGDGGGAGLHALALRAAERGPAVRPPPAVGRAPVDGRSGGAGAAPGRVAARRAVGDRGGVGGKHQRRGPDPRRCRPRALRGVGARGRTRVMASSPLDGAEDRPAQHGGVPVVGGRTVDRGRLRHGHPALHGVDPDRVADQPGV